MTDTTNKPTGEQDTDFTIDEILVRQRRMALIWTIDDVKQRRPDLDDEQCRQVLQACLDAEHGINWDTIDQTAFDKFGTSVSERVERFAKALAAYEDPDLVDLLADAMHWAKANDHDFDAVLRTARMHFDAETTGE